MRRSGLALVLVIGSLVVFGRGTGLAAGKKPPAPPNPSNALTPEEKHLIALIKHMESQQLRLDAQQLRQLQHATSQIHALVRNFDFQVTASEDAKVRTMELPVEFDDKGKVKKYTQEELKQLKGDNPAEQKLAGYKSDYTSMKVGDTVIITLSKKKAAPKKDTDKPAAKKDEDKDAKKDDDKDVKKDKAAEVKKDDDKPVWVSEGQLLGKVVKIQNSSEQLFTIRVTTTGYEMQHANLGNKNKNNETVIDPDLHQVTSIVIQEHAPEQKARK